MSVMKTTTTQNERCPEERASGERASGERASGERRREQHPTPAVWRARGMSPGLLQEQGHLLARMERGRPCHCTAGRGPTLSLPMPDGLRTARAETVHERTVRFRPTAEVFFTREHATPQETDTPEPSRNNLGGTVRITGAGRR